MGTAVRLLLLLEEGEGEGALPSCCSGGDDSSAASWVEGGWRMGRVRGRPRACACVWCVWECVESVCVVCESAWGCVIR